jgi:hypothetical protein
MRRKRSQAVRRKRPKDARALMRRFFVDEIELATRTLNKLRRRSDLGTDAFWDEYNRLIGMRQAYRRALVELWAIGPQLRIVAKGGR